MIPQLVGLIKSHEGLHDVRKDGLVYPYTCPAGYPTQGYGILVKSLSVPPITKLEAETRMYTALPYYVEQTLKLAPELLRAPPECLAAIADFVFNLGAGRFAASTLRRKIRAGDWAGACVELPKWKYGGGRVLPGLVRRRNDEVNLIRSSEVA